MNTPVRGRRRSDTRTSALTQISRLTTEPSGRRRAEAPAPARSVARKAGVAAATAGLLAVIAIPVAHAGGDGEPASMDRASDASALGLQVPQDANLRFDRAELASKAAQEEARAAAASAEKKKADAAAQKAAAEKKAAADKKAKAEAAAKKKAAAIAAAKKADAAKAKTAGFATGTLKAPIPHMKQTSGFGYRMNPITGAAGELHTGIDYAMGCGTPVNASDGGKVVEAGFQVGGGGNRIVVEHRGGLKTTYNHLQSIGVSLGQKVAQGERIGELGTTGNSTGCHLHFEVVKDGQTVDPAGWL
ncbi:M23 family metallopeptidase [Arthrobacter sulfonylureivorans]|uniref:M23 family metallopeptidase n=1 Tax=Arthrobacter sulfonylureivorans TaxID=2486855 RepID=UPI0039E2F7C9